MPDYVYIDPSGNMLDNNYRDTPQAAITHARLLAVEHQVARVCVALVTEYRVQAPRCHMCNKYFSGPVIDEGWPTCPACDVEPSCPSCGSKEINYTTFICTKCGKGI